ncbi:MAG: AAA family ATPase [Spirochaetes bacterium]|nr:AAA family ATPase [Spirochaetota bacterium]
MQLLECIVSKAGLFNNINLKFDKGLTVIYGRNESGKTLIAKAIIDTLWGEFSGNYSLNGNTWDNMYSEVSFNNSFGRYKFIKKNKDLFLINFTNTDEDAFGKEKEILKRDTDKSINSDNDGTWFVKLFESTNDRETARLFDKVDIQTFMEVSYLADPINITNNGKPGCSNVQKFILNDNSGFYTLYENITDTFNSNGTTGNANNSIINEILKKEIEIQKINKKLQIYDIQNLKSDRINKEKTRLIKESKKLYNELYKIRSDKSRLLNVQNYLKNLSDIDAAKEEKKNEKQIEQQKTDSIIKLEEYIKDHYPQFHNFEEKNIKNLKKIQETYREVRDVHEEIENFYLLRSDKKNKFKNIIFIINISSICILSAFMGISSLAFPIQFLNVYKIHCVIGLLSLSISSSLLFLIYYILTSRSNDLKRIMRKKSDVEKKLEETLHKNNITLNEYKLEAIYEYLVKYFEEYGEYSISQTELLNMKESLKGNDYIKTIDGEIDKLNNDKTILKNEIDKELKLLDESISFEIDIVKINKLLQSKNHKIRNLKESINNNNKIISQIEKEICISDEQANEIKAFNEEKANIQNSLSVLNNYKISIIYLVDLLKEAIANREEKQIIELVKDAGRNFHFLTDHQYNDSVTDEIIKKAIRGENLINELNPSILHMLLLSIKFAATNAFDDLEFNLPLIIDEPFQQMDDQRISRFKKLLDDISLKRQVIIFTRSSKYKDWGSYIEL